MSNRARRIFGLSYKLLGLTVAFVLLAEILIYLPSITSFRNTWLAERLDTAAAAVLVFDAIPPGADLPEPLAQKVLANVQAQLLAVSQRGERRVLAANAPQTPAVDVTIDRRDETPIAAVKETIETLLLGGNRTLALIGDPPGDVDSVELVIHEKLLRDVLLSQSAQLLLLSLLISLITAFFLYLALTWLLVAPIERLTGAMVAFREAPDDGRPVLTPSGRRDELGLAEHELLRMQAALGENLRQKTKLAALGLAVAKINHDLRNILTGAQLMSDRLAASNDPSVQQLAPRLEATIDRAITFCQQTLSYGRAVEPAPQPQAVTLRPMIDAIALTQGLDAGPPRLANDVDAGLTITADPEQLERMLDNLIRNAAQVLGDRAGGEIRVTARLMPNAVAITVADNGPGVPAMARAHLFEPFRSSARQGGTGLGLAIAADLARGHGGSIALDPSKSGAAFTITLPQAGAKGAKEA